MRHVSARLMCVCVCLCVCARIFVCAQVDHGAEKWRSEFVSRLKPLFVDNIEALAPYYARFFPLCKEVGVSADAD